jgi:hypothetical protein
MQGKGNLGPRVLSVFKQAVAAGRDDVAEHLLCALETLERDHPTGSSLQDAYLSLAAPRAETVSPTTRPLGK